MNFFRFPLLVQIEILKPMRLGELFLLSLTSKRTRKTIKYLYPKNDMEIAMEIDDAKVIFKTENRTEIVLKQQMDTPNYEERLEMLNSGKFHTVVRLGRSVYVFSDAEDVVLKMHKYLSDLINSKSAAFVELVDLIGSVYRAKGFTRRNLERRIAEEGKKARRLKIRECLVNSFRGYYNREPRDERELKTFLEFIDKVDREWQGYSTRRPVVSLIMDDSAGVSRVEKAVFNNTFWPDLEAYFSQLPNLKFCMINNGEGPETELPSCPAINDIDHLIMRNTGSEISKLLLPNRGKNVLLEKCHLCLEWPNRYDTLVENWKTGKRENLKTFIAYQDPEVTFDPEPYLRVFGDQTWDPNQRERFYPYESIITDYHKFPADTFDCEDGVDIVRDSDGRRATVKMTPQHFMFFVWPESRAEN